MGIESIPLTIDHQRRLLTRIDAGYHVPVPHCLQINHCGSLVFVAQPISQRLNVADVVLQVASNSKRFYRIERTHYCSYGGVSSRDERFTRDPESVTLSTSGVALALLLSGMQDDMVWNLQVSLSEIASARL